MTDLIGPVSGGCQCGAVRYRALLDLETAHICHCRMCQKAVGSPYAALVSAPDEGFVWTRGSPARFHSSASADRGFCRECGTPLYYRAVTSRHYSVTIGSLDDPASVPPRQQYGTEAELPWSGCTKDLLNSGTTEETMADDVAGIRSTNRQHPDRDTEVWPPRSFSRD